jgi:integrase/recombinase XerD
MAGLALREHQVSALEARVAEYLRLRRAMGFTLTEAGHLLPQFVAFLDEAGAQTITVELAVAWARLPQDVQPVHWAHRLGAVRGFARWLATIEPATQIPPPGVFAAHQQRRTPYIYSPAQVSVLLQSARQLQPALRAASYEALLGLLACSGMRVGEAISLARTDVDLTDGIVTVRHPKLGRERLVPLHPSATQALRGYADERDRLSPTWCCDAFFVSSGGGRLTLPAVDHIFTRLATLTGLRTATCRPRIHDLRHSLVVDTLIDWYRDRADGNDGVDVAARLPVLSTFLGHVNPVSTYWYVTSVPELMQLAAARLPDRLGQAAGTGS